LKISNFGNFNLREKAARPGRNPRTGEFRMIQPRRVVTFHASNTLKSQIEGKPIALQKGTLDEPLPKATILES
jgi:integration host factor subunit alpha